MSVQTEPTLQTEVSVDDILQATRAVTSQFTDEYYRELDKHNEYATDFVNAALESGLHTVMIPEEYGGWGLGVREASVITEEINYSGGAGSYIHATMFTMGIIARHGSAEQKAKWLPRVASGELRLTSFSLTEPNAGTDTSKLQTRARLENGEWVFSGQKIFTSRAAQTDLMVIMARTSESPDPKKPGLGISCFLVDIRDVDPKQLSMRQVPVMFNHHTYEVFLDDFRVPEDALIGEEGKGFKYLMDGLNAERIVIAAECIGDCRWFLDRSVRYANERVLFNTQIGKHQAVQHPLADGYINMRAANEMRWRATEVFDSGVNAGAESNMAKYLASNASWQLANAAMQTHGGYGLATEYDIERKFRETRIFQVAPVSPNMVLNYVSHHVLGLPKSY
jgi:acyl-CoA dehydrogenase